MSSDHQPHPPAASTTTLCPLCCEEDISEGSVACAVLSACRHRSCKACIVRWIEREEASGQATPPTCPFCRLVITEEDLLSVLGRPFQPRGLLTSGPSSGNGEEEVDDLTRQWLDEHTVPCGGCGSLIEKESGCDLIECLCGYRFCFSCKRPGGGCGCNIGHGFLGAREYISDDPIRDRSGRVDLKSCILRRRIRRSRMIGREKKERDAVDKWRYSSVNAQASTVNGRWLFSPKKNAGSVEMLEQQLGIESKRGIRTLARCETQESSMQLDATWLFLPPGADVRAMNQFYSRETVRRGRQRVYVFMSRRDILRCGTSPFGVGRDVFLMWDTAMDLSAKGLFLPPRAGMKVLQGMQGSVKKRAQRSRAAASCAAECAVPLSKIDSFIRSGAWLFEKKSPDESYKKLFRLVTHSRAFSRKTAMSRLLERMRNEEEEEKRCLESVLFVFPAEDIEEDGLRCIGGARGVERASFVFPTWEDVDY